MKEANVSHGRTKYLIPAAIALLACLPALADEVDPWLGVYLVDEVDGGIRVVAVVPGGPAAKVGLRSGDLLVEAADVQVADQEALGRLLRVQGVDQELSVEVLRNGEALTFLVRPIDSSAAKRLSRPAAVPTAPVPSLTFGRLAPLGLSAGLKTAPITSELRAHYGAPEDRGVLVVGVEASGPGGLAGIEVGDVLIGIGEHPVTTTAEVDLALARHRADTPLALELIRNRERLVKDLAPPEAPMPARVWLASPARERQLERSIELLERQLKTLRVELAKIKEASEPVRPASPDR
jgi:S1-C subfamily serine protease